MSPYILTARDCATPAIHSARNSYENPMFSP